MMGETLITGKDTMMSRISAHKTMAFLAIAVLLFMIGCTPGSSSSSSGGSNTSNTSTGGQLAFNPTPGTGGANDPTLDPLDNPGGDPVGGDPGGDPFGGDPGTDSDGDGAAASLPEPATGLLFLCAAGSMALARLRARKRT
jgi:hypothetical protein